MKQCKCPPNSPFHWRERAGLTDLSDLALSSQISTNASRTVERKRKEGIDMGNLDALSARPQRVHRTPQQFTTPGLE